MGIFIIDYRGVSSKDSRLLMTYKVLKETVALARSMSTSKWSCFGVGAFVGKTLDTVLPLQELDNLPVFAFNKAFDHLDKIISSEVSEIENFSEDGGNQSKLKGLLNSSLLNFVKQFKKLRSKNDKELLVTILTTNWERSIKNDLDEFTRSYRNAPIIRFNVIDLNHFAKTTSSLSSSNIRLYSLPFRGMETAIESVFKESMKDRLDVKLTFPNSGFFITARIESIVADLRFSDSVMPLQSLNELAITSTTSFSSICDEIQQQAIGQPLLLSCDDEKLKNSYLWKALYTLVRDNNDVLIAHSPSYPLYRFLIIPCEDFRMLLQPTAYELLQLPLKEFMSTGSLTSEFESAAETLQLCYEYDLDLSARLNSFLMSKWDDTSSSEGNSRKNQLNSKTKSIEKSASNALVHPALAMY